MSWTEILGLTGAFLGSLGGGAVIILGFSSWLGKIWATRILQTEKAELQKKAEFFKNELQKEIEHEKANLQREIEKAKSRYQLETEKNKAKYLRYSETQFKLYNDLWSALCGLEATSEELWETVTPNLVLKLKGDLIKAKKAVKGGYLVIEEDHYTQLLAIIERFERFEFGKSRLISLRKDDFGQQYIDQNEIEIVIERNRGIRREYADLLELVGRGLKQQISA